MRAASGEVKQAPMPPGKWEAGMGGLSETRERAAMGLQRSEPEAIVRDSATATGLNPNQWGVVLLQKREEEPWSAYHCSKEMAATAWQGPVK